jgi:tetratricopeptide (TPR) repeat protein
MEQRATIQERIGEYVLKISKPPRIPAQQGGAARANPDKFYPAWEEACRAQYGGEHRRAHYFYHQALTAAPEDVEAEALADIFDSLKEVNRILAQEEGRLPGLRAAVENDPADSETRFRYAGALWKLGFEEEAAKELEAVLEHPETICKDCLRDCWNNIGWSLYRKQEYARAIPWFERAAEVKSVGPMGELFDSSLPLENLILTYVELHLTEEAEKSAVDYVSRFGRLPWPERHALRKLGIDADALYVEHCGHAA